MLFRSSVGDRGEGNLCERMYYRMTEDEHMNTETAHLAPFTWNIVTRNLMGHPLLRKQLTRRVRSLGKRLVHYPPDGVHLHVLLEKNPHRDLFAASLTLRLPRHILHAEKTAREPILCVDKAFDAMEREVEKLRAGQRREDKWKRKERRQLLRAMKLPSRCLPERAHKSSVLY